MGPPLVFRTPKLCSERRFEEELFLLEREREREEIKRREKKKQVNSPVGEDTLCKAVHAIYLFLPSQPPSLLIYLFLLVRVKDRVLCHHLRLTASRRDTVKCFRYRILIFVFYF
jgi:hypothetical protein